SRSRSPSTSPRTLSPSLPAATSSPGSPRSPRTLSPPLPPTSSDNYYDYDHLSFEETKEKDWNRSSSPPPRTPPSQSARRKKEASSSKRRSATPSRNRILIDNELAAIHASHEREITESHGVL